MSSFVTFSIRVWNGWTMSEGFVCVSWYGWKWRRVKAQNRFFYREFFSQSFCFKISKRRNWSSEKLIALSESKYKKHLESFSFVNLWRWTKIFLRFAFYLSVFPMLIKQMIKKRAQFFPAVSLDKSCDNVTHSVNNLIFSYNKWNEISYYDLKNLPRWNKNYERIFHCKTRSAHKEAKKCNFIMNIFSVLKV